MITLNDFETLLGVNVSSPNVNTKSRWYSPTGPSIEKKLAIESEVEILTNDGVELVVWSTILADVV